MVVVDGSGAAVGTAGAVGGVVGAAALFVAAAAICRRHYGRLRRLVACAYRVTAFVSHIQDQRLLVCCTTAPVRGHKGPEFLVGLPRFVCGCARVVVAGGVFFSKTSALPLDLVMFLCHLFFYISMPCITQGNPPARKKFEVGLILSTA